jgi:hypothetical protein
MITIVEPHADDAFLSLGGHIEAWRGHLDVRIVTVYSGTRRRARDAEAYAHAVGAQWLGLGAIEKQGKGAAALRAAAKLLSDGGIVIVPLGIRHPEHKEVRDAAEALLAADESLFCPQYYLDQPYAATQSNGLEVNQRLARASVVSYLRPRAKKYRHIKLFKDQAKFFHFNPAEKLQYNIELIVEIP